MISAPTNWDELYAQDDSVLEVDLVVYFMTDVMNGLPKAAQTSYGTSVGGIGSTLSLEFKNEDIDASGCVVESGASEIVGIGNAYSSHLSFTLIDPGDDFEFLHENQQIRFFTRLVSADGQTSTPWVHQGVYYIDTVTANDSGSVSISAYDIIGFLDRRTSATSYSDSRTFSQLFGSLDAFSNCPLISVAGISDVVYTAEYLNQGVSYRDLLMNAAAIIGRNVYINKAGKADAFGFLNYADYRSSNTLVVPVLNPAEISIAEKGCRLSGVCLSGQYYSQLGYVIDVDLDDAFDPGLSLAGSIGQRALNGVGGYRGLLRKIVIRDTVLSPLLEIEDVVGVRRSAFNGSAYHYFAIQHIKMAYAGHCYGDILSGADRSVMRYSDYAGIASGGYNWPGVRAVAQTPEVVKLGRKAFSIGPIDLENGTYTPQNSNATVASTRGYSDQTIVTFNAVCLMLDGTTQVKQMKGYIREGVVDVVRSVGSNYRYAIDSVPYVSYTDLSSIAEIISTDFAIKNYTDGGEVPGYKFAFALNVPPAS